MVMVEEGASWPAVDMQLVPPRDKKGRMVGCLQRIFFCFCGVDLWKFPHYAVHPVIPPIQNVHLRTHTLFSPLDEEEKELMVILELFLHFTAEIHFVENPWWLISDTSFAFQVLRWMVHFLQKVLTLLHVWEGLFEPGSEARSWSRSDYARYSVQWSTELRQVSHCSVLFAWSMQFSVTVKTGSEEVLGTMPAGCLKTTCAVYTDFSTLRFLALAWFSKGDEDSCRTAGCFSYWLSEYPYCRPTFDVFGHRLDRPFMLNVDKFVTPQLPGILNILRPSPA